MDQGQPELPPNRRDATVLAESSIDPEAREFFISHAGEDKVSVARPLAKALAAAGWKVWLDELELTVGDSLTGRLNAALARSRFGVVVLSHAFFSKHWPQQELNALAAREAAAGTKVILPVWHGIDQAYLAAVAPMLADRLGVSTEYGVKHVAQQLIRALERAEQTTNANHDLPIVRSVVALDDYGPTGRRSPMQHALSRLRRNRLVGRLRRERSSARRVRPRMTKRLAVALALLIAAASAYGLTRIGAGGAFSVSYGVRLAGPAAGSWQSSVIVAAGDRVDWRVRIHNGTEATLQDVVTRIQIPHELQAGTTDATAVASSGPESILSSALTSGGYDNAILRPGRTVEYRFESVTPENFAGCSLSLAAQAIVGAQAIARHVANVRLVVRKTTCGNTVGIMRANLTTGSGAPAGMSLDVLGELHGERKRWRKTVFVRVGQIANWLIEVGNVSRRTLNNINVRVVLAPDLRVVPKSVQLYVPDRTSALPDEPLFVGGFNIGNYAPRARAYLTFDTTALGAFPGCTLRLLNYARIRADGLAEVQQITSTNSAYAVLVKSNC